MSLLSFESSYANAFVGSIHLARNMPGGTPGLVIVIGQSVGSPLYEDGIGLSVEHFGYVLHKRTRIPDEPLINRGLIQRGFQSQFPIIPGLSFTPGIYRLFFRFRAVCELVAWGNILVPTTQGHQYPYPGGTQFYLTGVGLSDRLKPGIDFIPDNEPGWTTRLPAQFQAQPFTAGPLGERITILNATEDPDQIDVKGCWYVDRICQFSVQNPPSIFNFRAAPSAFLADGGTYSQFFIGGTASNRFHTGSPPAAFVEDPGTQVPLSQNLSAAYYQNSARFNPTRLDNGLPMFTAADGDPIGNQVGQCQFLGARAESAIRPESFTDLTGPTLLTEFES